MSVLYQRIKANNLIIQVYQGHFLLSKCKLCVYYLNKTSIFKIYLGSDKKKKSRLVIAIINILLCLN